MLKEVDVLDRGRLALDQLFANELYTDDVLFSENEKSHFDGELIVNGKEFLFEVILHPTIAKLNKIRSSKRLSQKDSILIFDFASEEVSEYCKQNQVNYLDSAGNAFINAKELIIYIEGREGVKFKENSARIFQKTGLKLIFEFFRNPDLVDKPYRVISKYVEISTASVGNLMEELEKEKYLLVTGGGKRLSNLERLMLKWIFSYTEVLKPKLHRGYFKLLDEKNIDKIVGNSFTDKIYLSGEYGASFISERNYIKPSNLVLYTDLRISHLAKNYGIVPVDKGHDITSRVEIIEPFWSTAFDDSNQLGNVENRIDVSPLVAHDLIIYADLLNSQNPRSVEIAEEIFKYEIRDRFLKNFL